MRYGRLFFTIWGVVFALYVVCMLIYSLAVGHLSLAARAGSLLRPLAIVGAVVISLLITIPSFQFAMGARSRAYRAEVVRPSSDPFVLPKEAEEPQQRALRMQALRRQNVLSIQLWMLFVVLMSLVGLFLLMHVGHIGPITGQGFSDKGHISADTVVTMPEVIATTTPETYLEPKLGTAPRTDRERAYSAWYVQDAIAASGSREAAFTDELSYAWDSFAVHDSDEAMIAFNHAWLLNPTSSEVLWGMGLVEGVRGNLQSSIDLIREALTHEEAATTMHCDIARSFYLLHDEQATTSSTSSSPTSSHASSTEYLHEAEEELRIVIDADAMTSACYRTAIKVALARGNDEQAHTFEEALASSSEDAFE